MKRSHFATTAWIVVSMLVVSGCSISINRVSTGPLKTMPINIPMPADRMREWEVELRPGSAGVTVDSDAADLIDGTVEYNVDDWKPLIITSGERVEVRQGEFSGIPPANAVNDWRLKLGRGIPLRLSVAAGAIRGQWELGGLSLRTLNWTQGAADTTIRFSQPNPEKLDVFDVDAGASKLSIIGVANANLGTATINIGAGTLLLRFDGRLTRDVDITLTGGAAAITIDSSGNPVQVITGRGLVAVNRGDWIDSGNSYDSPEWSSATGAKITVRAELGAASVDLVSER